MSRILIFGNSGSGKTWLASKLSKKDLKHIALDDIFWLPGGYNQKRSAIEVSQEIKIIKSSPDWIVEGVFGDLLVELIDVTDVVVFLDFCWDECQKALLSRGSESSKQLDKVKAKEKFLELIDWASNYTTRKTKSSYMFHKLLYDQFKREKYILSCRNDVNEFLQQKNTHNYLTLSCSCRYYPQ